MEVECFYLNPGRSRETGRWVEVLRYCINLVRKAPTDLLFTFQALFQLG